MNFDPHDHAPYAHHQRDGTSRGQVLEPAAIPASPFSLAEVRALAAKPAALTVSILLPSHRAGPDKRQDHTRLKNSAHEAHRLLSRAVNDKCAQAIILPLTALIETPAFGAHPSAGLALFAGEAGVQHFWLPMPLAERVVVSEHCHIKPLMPLLHGDGHYYVLELTQHGVHLHVGSRFQLQAIELPGAPSSVDEGIDPTDHEHHTEVRSVQASGQGALRYFGSAGDEDAKERIKKFFRRVDASVRELLHGERAPLVIAGVEYLLPLYCDISSYPNLMRAGITGNPDLMETRTLHDRAWEIVAPSFAGPAIQSRERHARLHGSERTSDDLATIIRALHQGRVEDLFVATDTERWGTYDELNDKLREHSPRWPTDDDLLNVAVIHGLATGAQVQVVPRAMMPNRCEAAAVFRY